MHEELLFLLAVAPGAFLLFYFYLKDRYEHEPVVLVLLCFAAGAASVFLAMVLELGAEPLFTDMPVTFISIAAYTTLGVGLPEELSKLLAMRLVAYRHRAFNELMDGIVYTVAAGLGFATLENIFYVMELGFGTGVIRALLSVPMHAMFGVVLGYYVGLARMARNRGEPDGRLLVGGLLLATLMHGVYDFILFAFEDGALILGLLVAFYALAVWFAVRCVRRALAASPFRAAAGSGVE